MLIWDTTKVTPPVAHCSSLWQDDRELNVTKFHLGVKSKLSDYHRASRTLAYCEWWSMEETIDYGELRPVPTPKKLRRANLACRFAFTFANMHLASTSTILWYFHTCHWIRYKFVPLTLESLKGGFSFNFCNISSFNRCLPFHSLTCRHRGLKRPPSPVHVNWLVQALVPLDWICNVHTCCFDSQLHWLWFCIGSILHWSLLRHSPALPLHWFLFVRSYFGNLTDSLWQWHCCSCSKILHWSLTYRSSPSELYIANEQWKWTQMFDAHDEKK